MLRTPSESIRSLNLSPGMTVADCGRGTGEYTLALAQVVSPSGVVYAYDIQQSAIEALDRRCRELGIQGVYAVCCNLEENRATGLADNVLDACVCATTLFQNQVPEVLLKEIARVLKPEGQLLIVEWKQENTPLSVRPQSVRLSSQETLKLMLCELGFTHVVDVPDIGPYHYGLLAKR